MIMNKGTKFCLNSSNKKRVAECQQLFIFSGVGGRLIELFGTRFIADRDSS